MQFLKYAIFALVVLGASVQCQSQEVEGAGAILLSLVNEAEANLEASDAYWKENEPILKGVVDSVYNEFLTLEAECNSRQDQIGNSDQEIENSQHYLEWIAEKIEANKNKVTLLGDAHCDTSKLYIQGLKHNKIALKLIEFLRQAISEKDSLSLAQRKAIVTQLTVFFQMYAKNEVQALLSLKQDEDYSVDIDTSEEGRTDEEIGTKHVDDNREEIDVEDFDSSTRRDWPTYKKELLALLDTLEKQITESKEQAQDDQVAAGSSLADFQIKLEAENQELERHLVSEQDRIERIEIRKVKEAAYYDECKDELNIVFPILLSTRKEYDDKVYAQEKKRAVLAEEVKLFNEVNQMYVTKVNVDDSAADREVDAFQIIQ